LIGPDAHPQPDSFTAVVAARLQSVCHLAFPFAVSTTTILPVLLCWNAFLEPDGDGFPWIVNVMLFNVWLPRDVASFASTILVPSLDRYGRYAIADVVITRSKVAQSASAFAVAQPICTHLPKLVLQYLKSCHTFLHFVSIPFSVTV
jgi:hypothetical protein